MTQALLGRNDAPITSSVWELLDGTAVGVARNELAGRRLLDVDGPYGLGLKEVALSDEEVEDGVFIGNALPLAHIVRPFSLPARDLAAFEREAASVDLMPLVQATLDVVRTEDRIVFAGTKRTPGLLKGAGVLSTALAAWSDVGAAQTDVIKAVTALDKAGFHGPYALALGPARYNMLLRRFETAAISELDVMRTVATAGVVKAPGLGDGGVILQAGKEFAHIVIGQDLAVGFSGVNDARLDFFVSESVAVRVLVPPAVCVLGKPV
jgi:uncharacterized linocin/CFP29 family protein